MHFEINKVGIRRARLWLAGRIAPRYTDVHDPDETACPWMQAVLEETFWNSYRIDDQGRFWMNVTDAVQEAHDRDLVEYAAGGPWLTKAGERDLARRWGPDRVPPWSFGYYNCNPHGQFEREPGERADCPHCVAEKYAAWEALKSLPVWHWKRWLPAAR